MEALGTPVLAHGTGTRDAHGARNVKLEWKFLLGAYSSRRQDVHGTANAGCRAEKQAAAGRNAGQGTSRLWSRRRGGLRWGWPLSTLHSPHAGMAAGMQEAASAFLTAPCCGWERPVSLREGQEWLCTPAACWLCSVSLLSECRKALLGHGWSNL